MAKMIWTNNEGNKIVVYAQGEGVSDNIGDYWVVSKVPGSHFTFRIKKTQCTTA